METENRSVVAGVQDRAWGGKEVGVCEGGPCGVRGS